MFKLLVPTLALIALAAPTPTWAASDVTDVSAQRRGGQQRFIAAKPRTFSAKPRVVQPRVVQQRSVVRSTRTSKSFVAGPGRVQRNVVGPGRVQRNVNFRGPGVRPGQGVVRGLGVGPGRIVAGPARLGGVATIALRGNRLATIYRSPRRIYWGGRWRAFVPLAALGVVAVGGAYYYPDAYLAVGRPYCEGVAPNGCRLNWQRVGFEDGEGEMQCVQFCPRPGAIPPPNAVALTAAPPPPQGKCEITIYSAPKFASAAVPTSDDQPKLSESGWQNQIASVEVKAGTWELFTEEQYSGAAMRLSPGSYPELQPDWTKRINSFMCVEPSN